MNMSYCRWHNTQKDLADCKEHLRSVDIEEISDMELKAMKKMFIDILSMAETIKSHNLEEEVQNELNNRKE